MYSKYSVSQDMNVRDVITYMDTITAKAVIVLNEADQMVGLFADGDMRHFFLKGGRLQANIKEAMNPNPIWFSSVEEAKEYRRRKKLVIYPVVAKDMTLLDVLFDNMQEESIQNNELEDVPLVIMAGGKGTRLYPYTKVLPKALIPIGEKTISERIIDNFTQYGCKDIFFILNHKAGMIKAYFKDLKTNYQLHFFEEEEFLGTGGGLSLIKNEITTAFFLSNCDIIINADLACAYKTHKTNNNLITFVCAIKEIKIPYGVIETLEDGKVKKIVEKPEMSMLTNTGLYIVEPQVVAELTDGEFIHMPDIAQKYIKKGCKIGVFPVSEKAWLDMGQLDELENMKRKLENC